MKKTTLATALFFNLANISISGFETVTFLNDPARQPMDFTSLLPNIFYAPLLFLLLLNLLLVAVFYVLRRMEKHKVKKNTLVLTVLATVVITVCTIPMFRAHALEGSMGDFQSIIDAISLILASLGLAAVCSIFYYLKKRTHPVVKEITYALWLATPLLAILLSTTIHIIFVLLWP
jgi:hypothetical protein